MSWLTKLKFENAEGEVKEIPTTGLVKAIDVDGEEYTFTFTTIAGDIKGTTIDTDFEAWKSAVKGIEVGKPVTFGQRTPFESAEANKAKSTNNPSFGSTTANSAIAQALN